MKIKTTTLLKTVGLEDAELNAVTSEARRFLYARCKAKIEVYEDAVPLPILGGSGMKKTHYALVLGGDMTCTRKDAVELLEKIAYFELAGTFFREDGIFEKVYLSGLKLLEIDDKEWRFEISDPDIVNKIIALQ